mmetsp:Transcript_27276/g.32258  ORF Transcript_27276/g.32258 Transcript_27276/m.32258 type:complete len:102 (+) Transcript_27276:296-601(+)
MVTLHIHINWEMRVHKSHLVEESLSDTNDHVLNVRANGTHAGKLFAVGEPEVDADLVSDFHEVHVDVFEGAVECSAWACYGYITGFDDYLDSVGDRDGSGS